jgi:hypothetical protein
MNIDRTATGMGTRRLRHVLAGACAALVMLLAQGSAHAAELFRWVDDQGVTHFGDKVPPRYADRATKMGIRVPPPNDSARRATPSPNAAAPAPAAAAARPTQPPAAQRPPENLSCEEQMRRYRQSQECFLRFTNANGSKRAEAYQSCTELPEPQC